MARIPQAKKAGYPLDMEGFWLGDKFRIIAVIFNIRIAGFCAEIPPGGPVSSKE
jgi:hypothetical protein